jgi:hypothetical protein
VLNGSKAFVNHQASLSNCILPCKVHSCSLLLSDLCSMEHSLQIVRVLLSIFLLRSLSQTCPSMISRGQDDIEPICLKLLTTSVGLLSSVFIPPVAACRNLKSQVSNIPGRNHRLPTILSSKVSCGLTFLFWLDLHHYIRSLEHAGCLGFLGCQ